MRVGMAINYAGGFAETVTELADYEKAGLDIVFVPEAYSFDAVEPARLHRGPDRTAAARLGHPPAVLAHARADRDDRCRAGLRLRRPVHPGHRRVRAAGHRGLARRALRRAGGPHPRADRDLPDGVAPRPARATTASTTSCRCPRTRAPAWASRSSSSTTRSGSGSRSCWPRSGPGTWPSRPSWPKAGSRSSTCPRRPARSGAARSRRAWPSATRSSARWTWWRWPRC